MNKSHLIGALSTVLFSFISISANAALIGRLPATSGGTDYQAAYDDVLNITWVTDADLGGATTWDNQVAWADNLNYLGFTDWRLASMDVNGDAIIVNCSGVSESDCRDNELGYMFYQNMGGSSVSDKRGDQMVDGALLTDVQLTYWSGTEYNSGIRLALRILGRRPRQRPQARKPLRVGCARGRCQRGACSGRGVAVWIRPARTGWYGKTQESVSRYKRIK